MIKNDYVFTIFKRIVLEQNDNYMIFYKPK